jgi:hypothetical protein
MKLTYDNSNREVAIGDHTFDFRGDAVTVVGVEQPRHGGSTGRVYVMAGHVTKEAIDRRGPCDTAQYFPSVIGATWQK